jgi:hypothetical protein
LASKQESHGNCLAVLESATVTITASDRTSCVSL